MLENSTVLRVGAAVGALLLPLAFTGCSAAKKGESTAAPSAAVSASPTAKPSGSETPTPTPTPRPKATTLATDVNAIAVTGGFGEQPTVTFPAPFAVGETIVKVLSAGTGPVVGDNATAQINYHGINGTDSKVFDSSFDKKKPATFPVKGVIPGFTKALVGQKVGSRILVAIPSKDGYGDKGTPDGAIQKDDTIMFVIDILDASRASASGKAEAVAPNLPQVSGEPPALKLPEGYAAPGEVRVTTAITGDSKTVVTEQSSVSVKFLSASAKNGKVYENSYPGEPLQGAIPQVSPAWAKALIGKPVGSRVIVEVPNAYPNGLPSSQIPAGENLVYVIDLLFAQAPEGP